MRDIKKNLKETWNRTSEYWIKDNEIKHTSRRGEISFRRSHSASVRRKRRRRTPWDLLWASMSTRILSASSNSNARCMSSAVEFQRVETSRIMSFDVIPAVRQHRSRSSLMLGLFTILLANVRSWIKHRWAKETYNNNQPNIPSQSTTFLDLHLQLRELLGEYYRARHLQ